MSDNDDRDARAIRPLPLGASFRDPSGFVFRHDGVVYRQVNAGYAADLHRLSQSGLYDRLVADGFLVAHEEISLPACANAPGTRILRPEQLPFISYPYEWCFSQLKDAALLTLEIQRLAIAHGMSLKDASAYNVQFRGTRPVFIDTLSFEACEEGRPWVAYRQFCRHFLAPLALMARRDVRLLQLLRVHIDGVPLDLGSALLPRRSWLNPGLAMHIHLHARGEQRFSATDVAVSATALKLARVSRSRMLALLEILRRTIEGLDWRPAGTEWADYYSATNYTERGSSAKARYVGEFLEQVDPRDVWDLGANTGVFSRLAVARGIPVMAFDIDPAAVESHYRDMRGRSNAVALPLLLDLCNPSPDLGWHQAERDSLIARGPADCVMALALMHHLCIANNVPLPHLAAFLADICGRTLLIEFVPRTDSQVERLMRSRRDIFESYTVANFEAAFAPHFGILRRQPLEDSQRTLYLMRRLPRGESPDSPATGLNEVNP